jgi:hypothetical protein
MPPPLSNLLKRLKKSPRLKKFFAHDSVNAENQQEHDEDSSSKATNNLVLIQFNWYK